MTVGITLELHEAVARIVLDRPSVMNRFEGTMREDLLAALERVGDDISAISEVRINAEPPTSRPAGSQMPRVGEEGNWR